MALLNAQYDAIMRGYDEIRDRHRHELSDREAEIAQKIPAISALDDEAAALSVSAAKRRIADPDADLSLYNESMRKITEKRARLLLDGGYPADYLEMQYDCPHCRDSGYIGSEQCACFKKAAAALLYKEYSISGILEKENFSHFSFDWYSDTMKDKTTGKTARETAASACREALRFIERIGKEDNNLFIFGSTGVGKTFLTHCIAKEVLDRSWSALYFTAGDLFELLADVTFGRDGRNSSHLETILACDFLTIDDLGTELTNNLVATGFYQVLNERILRQKSTIISTNLPMQEISARYSERIFSRLTSHYTIIRLIGDDIRIQKKLRGGNR